MSKYDDQLDSINNAVAMEEYEEAYNLATRLYNQTNSKSVSSLMNQILIYLDYEEGTVVYTSLKLSTAVSALVTLLYLLVYEVITGNSIPSGFLLILFYVCVAVSAGLFVCSLVRRLYEKSLLSALQNAIVRAVDICMMTKFSDT